MYYSIKSGGWQRIAEPTGQEEGLLGIFPYEKTFVSETGNISDLSYQLRTK